MPTPRGGTDGGQPGPRGGRVPLDAEDAIRASEPLPDALPVLPLRETVTFPETLTPLAVGQERSIKLVDDVLGANRMLAMVAARDPENEEPGPEGPLRGRRRRRRRPHAQGPRRHPAHPRPGNPAGAARPLRRRGALPGGADRRAARRGRGRAGAGGADPQRPAHLLGDHRADPLPARGAADGGRQPRRSRRARPPDRRRAAHLHRGEAGAARGGRRRRPPPPPLPDPRPRARGRPARHPDPVPGAVRDRQGPARVLPAPADESDPGRAGGG